MRYISVIPALAAIATAWSLDFYTTDNRHVNTHGTLSSGCKTLSFSPALNVNRVVFDPATPLVPDPNVFELYLRANCQGLSYRNDGGSYVITPRVIRSYKVYRD